VSIFFFFKLFKAGILSDYYDQQFELFYCRFAGVHPQSQEAYEMASTGLLKPAPGINVPLLYGARCVEFTPPNLTMGMYDTWLCPPNIFTTIVLLYILLH
jgi:hypothetical protein